jgi:hypothetical protein
MKETETGEQPYYIAQKIRIGRSLLDLYLQHRDKPCGSVVVRMTFDLIEVITRREPFKSAWEMADDDTSMMILAEVEMILEHRIQEAFGEAIRVDGFEPRPWRFALDEAGQPDHIEA